MVTPYRAAFIAGVGLYVVVFACGIGYAISTKGRLPEMPAQPLTQATELLERGDVARAAQQYKMAARLASASIAA